MLDYLKNFYFDVELHELPMRQALIDIVGADRILYGSNFGGSDAVRHYLTDGLRDLTGWDTRLSVLRYLHATLGDKFRPCPLIIKRVAARRLGSKSGHGVYKYESGQRVPASGLKASAL